MHTWCGIVEAPNFGGLRAFLSKHPITGIRYFLLLVFFRFCILFCFVRSVFSYFSVFCVFFFDCSSTSNRNTFYIICTDFHKFIEQTNNLCDQRNIDLLVPFGRWYYVQKSSTSVKKTWHLNMFSDLVNAYMLYPFVYNLVRNIFKKHCLLVIIIFHCFRTFAPNLYTFKKFD